MFVALVAAACLEEGAIDVVAYGVQVLLVPGVASTDEGDVVSIVALVVVGGGVALLVAPVGVVVVADVHE